MSDFTGPTFPSATIQPASMQRLLSTPAPEVFSNQMRMGVTLTDFTIVFGVAVTAPTSTQPMSEGRTTVSDRVAVHVAPGMLKQMLLNIEMAVGVYEEVMGEIKIPENTKGHLAAHRAGLLKMMTQLMTGRGSGDSTSP